MLDDMMRYLWQVCDVVIWQLEVLGVDRDGIYGWLRCAVCTCMAATDTSRKERHLGDLPVYRIISEACIDMCHRDCGQTNRRMCVCVLYACGVWSGLV